MTTKTIPTPCVVWHDAGPLWAGDQDRHPSGFYLFRGEGIDPEPVRVFDDYGDEIIVGSNE